MGNEPHPLLIPAEFLEGHFLLVDEGHHTVSVAVLTLALQHDQISVEDGVIDHGLAPHPQHEQLVPLPVDGVGHFDGDRPAFGQDG